MAYIIEKQAILVATDSKCPAGSSSSNQEVNNSEVFPPPSYDQATSEVDSSTSYPAEKESRNVIIFDGDNKRSHRRGSSSSCSSDSGESVNFEEYYQDFRQQQLATGSAPAPMAPACASAAPAMGLRSLIPARQGGFGLGGRGPIGLVTGLVGEVLGGATQIVGGVTGGSARLVGGVVGGVTGTATRGIGAVLNGGKSLGGQTGQFVNRPEGVYDPTMASRYQSGPGVYGQLSERDARRAARENRKMQKRLHRHQKRELRAHQRFEREMMR